MTAKRAIFALFVAFLSGLYFAHIVRAGGEAESAFPYDLAFAQRNIHYYDPLDVSPDGRFVAYVVTDPVADVNRDVLHLPSGAPSSALGNRIYLAAVKGGGVSKGAPREICPGTGNKWYPAWSPDSQSLAFYSDADGRPRIWLYERAKDRCRRLSALVIRPHLFAGGKAQWAPDSDRVYIPVLPEQPDGDTPLLSHPDIRRADDAADVRVYGSGGEAIPAPADADTDEAKGVGQDKLLRQYNSDLVAIDVKSGDATTVVPADAEPRPMALRISPSGRWMSYLSVFKRGRDLATSGVITLDVAVAPTNGGAPRRVAKNLPNLNEFSNSLYGWHPEKDLLIYIRDGKLWRVNFDAGKIRKPQQIAPGLDDIALTVQLFTRDGAAVVVGVNPGERTGFAYPVAQQMMIVPLDGGAPRPVPLDGAKWTFGAPLSTDGNVLWQPEGESITLRARDKKTGERAFVRVNLRNGKQTVLWRGLAQYSALSAAGRHDFLIGLYEDFRTPLNLYRFATDMSREAPLSSIEPRLEKVDVGTFEIFHTRAPLYDGTLANLRTTVLMPPGVKKGDPPPPAIVMIYPQTDMSGRVASFGGGAPITVAAQLFVSRGFAVVLPHVKIGPLGKAGQPLDEMVDVLMPQIYRAAELGHVDINRLAITGQSYGGYATAGILTRTKLFKAAVSLSSYYDTVGTYGHFLNEGMFGPSYWETGQGRMGDHPWADMQRYLDNSPYHHVAKITTPLLIIKGEEDMLPTEGEKLFNALSRLSRTVQLALYAGEGHELTNWRQRNAVDAAQRMVDFYRKYLMSGPENRPE